MSEASERRRLEREQKTLEKLNKERERLYAMREYERMYDAYEYISGLDEVGRGPLAGPVMVGVVILPKDAEILYVNDSKKLSEKKREMLYDEIKEKAIAYNTAVVSPQRIDEINILQAVYEAAYKAVEGLKIKPDCMLNDAMIVPRIPERIHQVKIIKGDAKSVSIASASIIAKVERDRLMVEYDKLYPEYGFASNKGYGSAAHIEAIKKYGPCPIHRKSFITNFINE